MLITGSVLLKTADSKLCSQDGEWRAGREPCVIRKVSGEQIYMCCVEKERRASDAPSCRECNICLMCTKAKKQKSMNVH